MPLLPRFWLEPLHGGRLRPFDVKLEIAEAVAANQVAGAGRNFEVAGFHFHLASTVLP